MVQMQVEKQPAIATTMAEFGYTAEVITQGKALLTETREAYNANKTEDDETSAAYNNFSMLKENLANTYALHRKKAKVIFRNNSLTMDQLAVSGQPAQSIPKMARDHPEILFRSIGRPSHTGKIGTIENYSRRFNHHQHPHN